MGNEDKAEKTLRGALKLALPVACVAALAAMWLWGYGTGRKSAAKEYGGVTVSRAETVTVRKTTAPVPVNERRVGVATVPVRVEPGEPQEPDSFPDGTILVCAPAALQDGGGERDTATLPELPGTALPDTLRAVVPITQKEYKDSLYTAWVSGFMPRLDSIEVRGKAITIRETVTKRNAFSVGVTGGVGYGVLSRKPDFFIGVGATLQIFGK